MHKCWFKIYELSVRAMLAYAKPCRDGSYRFDLNKAATQSCIKLPVREQAENALFDQLLMRQRHKLKVTEGEVVSDLLEVIFYADFSGIFDRDASDPYYAELQAKAKWLFLPGSVYLDLGGGKKCYCAFERSQSMSRASRLAFIVKDRYDYIYPRIMLGMKIGECQLSKLYAYNALMFSNGVRIEGLDLNENSVIVVDNPHYVAPDTDVITVEGRSGGEYLKCDRVEKKQDVSVLGFDGEGLISPRLAKQICKQLDCDKTSFQIRLPFVKGMLHCIDFHDFFSKSNTGTLTDIWEQKHKIYGVDIILTKSMVKCLSWLKANKMSWADYWKEFRRYDHALYISGMSKDEVSDTVELNYQFVATLSMTADEFRPADLPYTYPENDDREWLTKATEKEYHQLCCDDKYRQQFFTSKRYKRGSREKYMKEMLLKNPKLIAEHYFTDMLKKKADKVLKNYALGRLTVTGYNRYLSGDLLEFMRGFLGPTGFLTSKSQKYFRNETTGIKFEADSFYAPGARVKVEEGCTILRNPHISRNEELQLKPYTKIERLRNTYLRDLTDTVMISWDTLTAERLGGADFDGDMVKIITDELVNRCVRRNYSGAVKSSNNIPLLKIPSFEPILRDANDWEARFETVRSTFSSRIGQISNAALNRSLIAYNEKSSEEQRKKCREQTETLAILTGLEIDSAKTGVKPDLSEYLNEKELPKSKFLQYKALLEKAEKRREWYEPTYKEQFEKFFEKYDWDNVESNLERLPNLAYRLGQSTKFKKDKHASDEELFVFAQRPDWKELLDGALLEKVSALIDNYNNVLDRIRLCNQPIGNKRRQSDIRRILYRRGQDVDVDELYAAFTGISADRIADIRAKLTEHQWLFTHPERREELLSLWLPELEDYYKLLCDFRGGGFRILSDIICDIDDENRQSDSRKYYRDNDSEQFRTLMSAYLEMPAFQNYREAVEKKCREILFRSVKPDTAVKCFAALGKRKEMLELLYDKLEKHIRRCRDA